MMNKYHNIYWIMVTDWNS